MTEPTPDEDVDEKDPAPPGGDFDLTTSPRTAAARDMPAMLQAVAAQRLQLEQLSAEGVGVALQLSGLRLVEEHLPALVQYATQLEGVAAGLSVLKSPPDITAPLASLAAALEHLAAALPASV